MLHAQTPAELDVTLRVFAPDGSLPQTLTRRELQLWSGGVRLQCDLFHDEVVRKHTMPAPHALLDLAHQSLVDAGARVDPDAGPDFEQDLLQRTKALLRDGWRVSILEANGGQTPYLSSAKALRAALAAVKPGTQDSAEAIRQLRFFPGRHAAFFFGHALPLMTDGEIAAVHDAFAVPYLIDPTLRREPDTVVAGTEGLQHLKGSGSAPDFDDVPEVFAFHPAATDLPVRERDLRQAVRDATTDGQEYYVLRVASASPSQPLRLRVRIHGQSGVEYRLEAQAWTSAGQTPRLTVAFR